MIQLVLHPVADRYGMMTSGPIMTSGQNIVEALAAAEHQAAYGTLYTMHFIRT